MALSDLIGSSARFRTLLDNVDMVAPMDSAVLIQGETGTGKEVIARAIHEASPRRKNRFVALNCAAIPSTLLESELFGHEKGAFTGAVAQNLGRFQAADHGTLFLDEIGDLPLELQPKLLRALQEKQFERLGGGHTHQVDVRIIAATNQDLGRMVQERKFRADLYYRLNVFPMTLPPLRERGEDIPLLAEHFVQKFAKQQRKAIDTIPHEVMEALEHHDWRRVRRAFWWQWTTPRKRLAELIRLGASPDLAVRAAGSRCGPWRASSTPALHQALSNAYLASLGLVSVAAGR